MRRLTPLIISLAVPLLLGANAPVASDAELAKRLLLGKWIVRSVQIDGKPNKSQTGQKVGDVIEIKEGASGIAFG